MASWETTTGKRPQVDIEDKFRPTLVNRAKKRHGTQVGERKWVVDGNDKLGDSYEDYFVTLPEGGFKYDCSCQGHQGGEFRKICSHILYVTLARKGRVQMDIDLHHDEPLPKFTGTLDASCVETHVGYPLHGYVPSYVEGSGSSPEEVREALDAEFCTSMEYRPLPKWVMNVRSAQHDALVQIEQLYEEGKKVVFLDAPTGTGKTLIGEMVRRKMSPARAVYTCSTLTLQDQFLEDFDYADVIKGRTNYPTELNPEAFPIVNAGLCTSAQGGQCDLCTSRESCPYNAARDIALKSRLAVANIAYLLTMANYQKRFTNERFIIVDEADVLEQQLLSFITLSLTKGRMRQYGITPPKKKTVVDSWVEWVREEAYPKILKRTRDIEQSYNWRKNPKLSKEMMGLGVMLYRLRDLGGWDSPSDDWLDEDEHGMEGWVYMDYEKGDVTFKPIKVTDYAQELLWRHSKKWLLMSATIISAQQMAEDLGLEDDEWGVVTIGSDFPLEARPIYVQPVANMVWKEQDVEWPKMARAIEDIATYHEGERILVHTVSYKLAEYIRGRLVANGSRVFTYANAKQREGALKKWLKSENGVMLAPSFDRGVDLKDDMCRVIIVAKVPFPALGDKQINGRLYARGGQGWYSMLTIRSIVQMTGRAMRSRDDSCETYILDLQFVKNIMSKNRKMIPTWWSDALVRSGIPKERGIR